jgi:hypothetical protein
MGGQACVFYGAAQVSKDVDFLRSCHFASQNCGSNLQSLSEICCVSWQICRRIAGEVGGSTVMKIIHGVNRIYLLGSKSLSVKSLAIAMH